LRIVLVVVLDKAAYDDENYDDGVRLSSVVAPSGVVLIRFY